MLSPYSTVVEKLHRDVNKERVTMMKVERAGDVLVDAVSFLNTYTYMAHGIFIYASLNIHSNVSSFLCALFCAVISYFGS